MRGASFFVPVLSVVLGGLLGGCIVPAPSSESSTAAAKTPPAVVTSGANFGGKVELVRATYRPARVVMGEPVRVMLTFRVLQTIQEDYTLFVHVEDGSGRVERRNADHLPMEGSRPTHTWKAGETINDEFNIDAPPGASRLINVWMGFWQPERDTRLSVINADRVRTDGHDRVLVGQLMIGAL